MFGMWIWIDWDENCNWGGWIVYFLKNEWEIVWISCEILRIVIFKITYALTEVKEDLKGFMDNIFFISAQLDATM